MDTQWWTLTGWIYIAGILVVTGLLLTLLNRALARLREGRIERLRRQEGFQPLATETPQDDPDAHARQTAIRSVRSRYSIIVRTLSALIVLIGVVALSLPFLGRLPAAVTSATVGALAVILGFAARPLVENFIAGMWLSVSNQLRVGDTVKIDGEYGTVEDITMTHTVLKVWNWQRYVLPNGLMLQKELINYSKPETNLWTHIECHVGYEADLQEVTGLAIAAAKASPYFDPIEDPQVWAHELGATSIRLWIAAWARTPLDAWYLRNDIRTGLATAFRERGIPTHRQHLQLENAPVAAGERSGPPPG